LAMPSPAPCNARVPEVGVLPSGRVMLHGHQRYYDPVRFPPHCRGLRCGLVPRRASAAFDFTGGCGRASPVHRPTFAACHLPYAGAVPGCSRIRGPDCCLRPCAPGSARSVPHGCHFRRGSVRVRYGLQLRFSSLRRPDLAGRRRLTTGLLWWLTRTGLTPAGWSTLDWAHGTPWPDPQMRLMTA
jgi:hypothetical protein